MTNHRSPDSGQELTFQTKIQLMNATPYKVIAVYPFLYNPADDCYLQVGNRQHSIKGLEDHIDQNGNITRYIRFI